MCNPGVKLFKNLNPYWGAATGLALWFLVWHTPTFWRNRRIFQIRDLALAVHILAAATIYLACAHNCLITPSLHPRAKVSHTWIGRLGLVSGIISFSLGAFLAWSRLALGSNAVVVKGSTTLGFAIPITIGGILQIVSEINGFRAIRTFKSLTEQLKQDKGKLNPDETRALQQKKHGALVAHINWMLNLFVLACSVPAGIRLAQCLAGGNDGWLSIVMIVLVISVLQTIAGRYVKRMIPPLHDEQHIVAITGNPQSYNSISE